ncbi:TPA: hypothetical protein ACYFS9_005548, partial [Klebsiella pneumoniae]
NFCFATERSALSGRCVIGSFNSAKVRFIQQSLSSLQTPFTSVLWLKCHFWFLPCFAIKDVPQMRQIQLQERPFSTLAISTILFETVSNPNGIHFCELRRMNIPR